MTALDELMHKIRLLAEELYPHDLYSAYLELEQNLHDRTRNNAIIDKIRKLKQKRNTGNFTANWASFFEKIIDDVKNGNSIPIRDVVTLEHAPEDQAERVINLLNAVADKRASDNSESIRVCQSIYPSVA